MIPSVAELGVHVLIENCWTSHSSDPRRQADHQVLLVQKGCTQPGTNWARRDDGQGEATPEKLTIFTQLTHGSYVHCQLSVCYGNSLGSSQQVSVEWALVFLC
jgi:hypothetical protein